VASASNHFESLRVLLMNVRKVIQAYHENMSGEHHRYRSWEHCYRFFRDRERVSKDGDHAALQLGFYLASWGMYRGSSFLLQHSSTVHRAVVDQLMASRFFDLWTCDFGSEPGDVHLIAKMMEAARAIREAYRPFAPDAETRQASATLVTKVMLGTFGCLPAFDRYFLDGAGIADTRVLALNPKAIEELFIFAQAHLLDLRAEQARIERAGSLRYPLMKLVDMYFWQLGFENAG
jgi:hypothetical protein